MNKVYLLIQTNHTDFSHAVIPLWAYYSEAEATENVLAYNSSFSKPKDVDYSYIEIEVI